MSLLDVEGLCVDLGRVPVLSEVSFSVGTAERVGLIGESGSGKSVTALAILGLLPASMTARGTVRLEGEDLLAASERRRAQLRGDRVAMVFQEPTSALDPLMRVGRQVGEVLRIHRGASRRQAHAEAVRLLGRVGFADPEAIARAFPHQLSGGQRQRVVLASAVACRPSLVVADEPTTALDVTVQAQVLDLLRHLVEESGSALLLISHDLAVVSSTCERLVVLYGGRVLELGRTAEVLEDPRHPYTAGLLATAAAVSDGSGLRGRLPALAGSVPSIGAFPSGCVYRNRCERADEACLALPRLESGQGDHRFACWHPLETGRAPEPRTGEASQSVVQGANRASGEKR
jgi:peptide/nickel transport system ATP-binding protein